MNGRYGALTARLTETPEIGRLDELAEMINRRIHPLEPVGASDIFVRGMYIVSDEVNSFGGRFPVEEYPALLDRLINTPVLVGHRKDSLPIGRTFHATQEERREKIWVKSLFYWLRSAEDAQTLADNIDGGIYQECSIGFIYRLPQCSICGKDIRMCEHQVFSSYPKAGGEEVCHFNYREIDKVLETSLVYRGANPGTGMARELGAGGDATSDVAEAKKQNGDQLVAIPWYDGIPARLIAEEGEVRLERQDGGVLCSSVVVALEKLAIESDANFAGQLIGYRGKERRSRIDLERYLEGKSSPVTRVELRLLPSAGENGGLYPATVEASAGILKVCPTRYCQVQEHALDAACREIGTKEGLRVWPRSSYDPFSDGKRWSRSIRRSWYLTNNADRGMALVAEYASDTVTYGLSNFDHRLWHAGRSFFADTEPTAPGDTKGSREYVKSVRIIPVKLNGKERFLIRTLASAGGQ